MALARFKDLCLDATDPVRLGTFWAAALGLELHALDDGDVVLRGRTPEHTVWVNAVPEPRTVKARMHLDLNVLSVQSLVDLGATVEDDQSFRWTLMRDPEGTEFCAFVRDRVDDPLYEIGIDAGPTAEHAHRIAAWWAEMLGAQVVDHVEHGYSSVESVPGAPFETLDFAPVPEPRTTKNRVHLDVVTEHLDGLLAAGATVLLPEGDGLSWTVLADPDGNEFCAFVER